MTFVLNEILEAFYAELAKSNEIAEETISELRKLLESGKKLKADDFVDILSAESKRPAP